MRLDYLKKSIEKSLVINKGGYPYIIHPLTDGIPKINPCLLEEITLEMQDLIGKCGDIDKIVTIEAMGIPIATALSLSLKIPFNIIRKRKYDLKDEVTIEQVTGYSKSKLYINGLKKGEKIIIIDDVLSTGRTIRAVLTAFKNMGLIIKGVFIVIDKSNLSNELMQEYGIKIFSLVNINIAHSKVTAKII